MSFNQCCNIPPYYHEDEIAKNEYHDIFKQNRNEPIGDVPKKVHLTPLGTFLVSKNSNKRRQKTLAIFKNSI